MLLRFLAFLQASHDRSQCRRRRLQFESLENRRMLAIDTTAWPLVLDPTPSRSSNRDGTLAVLAGGLDAEYAVLAVGSADPIANVPADSDATAPTDPSEPASATTT